MVASIIQNSTAAAVGFLMLVLNKNGYNSKFEIAEDIQSTLKKTGYILVCVPAVLGF